MPEKVDTNTIHNFVCGKDQTEHLNGNNVLDYMQLKLILPIEKGFCFNRNLMFSSTLYVYLFYQLKPVYLTIGQYTAIYLIGNIFR